jgi:hypothetical protein
MLLWFQIGDRIACDEHVRQVAVGGGNSRLLITCLSLFGGARKTALSDPQL